FKQFPSIECVVLNACYSEVQAKAIVKHIPHVIGMNQAVGDQAAIEFATGFYDGLGYGRSYPAAYELGVSAIDLEGLPDTLTPVLLGRSASQSGSSGQSAASPATATPPTAGKRVFISYRDQLPDRDLAQQFYQVLLEAGHQPFMAGASLQLGETWAARIRAELQDCDYFVLLLSAGAATSEMVTEEVKRAKALRDERGDERPLILPIRVKFAMDDPLNYELRGYLAQIQQRDWQSEADTAELLAEVASVISGGQRKLVPVLEEMVVAPAIETVDQPPLPVAEPELKREPGGSVPLTSGLYVERSPIEHDCFTEIEQPGALIRIKAPRQMGKTSLMSRILSHARDQGYEAIPISFQRADSRVFTDLDDVLRWFCEQLGRRLKKLREIDDYWIGSGSKDKCNAYFEECILADLDRPLVLGLDEVDMVFPHRQVADDVFALMRSWYESARYGDFSSELWEKLRLVIVHSTEVYVPLNINQSPFNVGKNVELPEFSAAQVTDLARRYGLDGTARQVEALLELVGGHPYLVRKALYHLRREDLSLDALLDLAATEGGIYSDHLRRHLYVLQDYPELAAAFRQVVARSRAVEIEAEVAFKLESMGLVRLTGNEALPRCAIYRDYFRDHLEG
ncbi:AAA-like domain-containing protein, partial [filamentous cyanobacterium LEGE 11480]